MKQLPFLCMHIIDWAAHRTVGSTVFMPDIRITGRMPVRFIECLSCSQCNISLVPLNGAEFACLQGFQRPENLLNTSSHGRVVD